MSEPCKFCGSTEPPVTLYHTCDKMDLEDHVECNDRCRPREDTQSIATLIAENKDTELHELDTVVRCECGVLVE